MLTLRVRGVTYDTFESATVTRSIEAASGAFSFTTSANEQEILPVFIGDAVEVLADNVLVMAGYIEGLTVGASPTSHGITVKGRDFTGDLIDSTVPTGLKEFVGGVTLTGVAESIIKGLGLDKRIRVEDITGGVEPFDASEIAGSPVSGKAFQFIEKLAQKRQVLVTVTPSAGFSTLVFTRASLLPSGISVINRVGDRDGVVKSSTYTYDATKLFGKYLVRSQMPSVLQDFGITPGDLSNQKSSEVLSGATRAERFLEITAKSSMDSKTCEQRAIWEANYRLAQAVSYKATFAGHSPPNGEHVGPWEPNLFVGIIDEFSRINGPMLTKAVTFKYSIGGGSETEVAFVPRGSYSLTKPQDAAKSGGLPDWVTPELKAEIQGAS